MDPNEKSAVPGTFEYLKKRIETRIPSEGEGPEGREQYSVHLTGENLGFVQQLQREVGMGKSDTMRLVVLLARAQVSTEGPQDELFTRLDTIDDRLERLEEAVTPAADGPQEVPEPKRNPSSGPASGSHSGRGQDVTSEDDLPDHM